MQSNYVNWTGAEYEDYVVHCFVGVTKKARFPSITPAAAVLKYVSSKHPTVGIKVSDLLLEDIISGLESPEIAFHQRRLGQVKFLAELYNYYIVGHSLIFDTLYLILTYAHDEQSARLGTLYKLDGPNDTFRIRLVCTILETCGKVLASGRTAKKLEMILILFQRYIMSKEELPSDVVYAVDDVFSAIKPGKKKNVFVGGDQSCNSGN